MNIVDKFTKVYLNVILEQDESTPKRWDLVEVEKMKADRPGFNPVAAIMSFSIFHGFRNDKEYRNFIELLKRGISPDDPDKGIKDDDDKEVNKCVAYYDKLEDFYNFKTKFSDFPTFFDLRECVSIADNIINETGYLPHIHSSYFQYFFPKLLKSNYKKYFISAIENRKYWLLLALFEINKKEINKAEFKNTDVYVRELINIYAENSKTFRILLDIADIKIPEPVVKALLNLNNKMIDCRLAGNYRLGNITEKVRTILLNRYKENPSDIEYFNKKFKKYEEHRKNFDKEMKKIQ